MHYKGLIMKQLFLFFSVFFIQFQLAAGDENSGCSLPDIEFKKGSELFDDNNVITAVHKHGVYLGQISYKECWIDSLAVKTGMQKKGIGAQLFHQAVADMNDCDKIEFMSHLTALDFYFKQGAQIDAHHRCYIKEENAFVDYQDLTAEAKAAYLNHLYQEKKKDPTNTHPYIHMYVSRKR